MLQEQEWLQLLEVVKKESYPVYGEDFEDTVSENLIYCAERINAERKRRGRRKQLTPELIRKKVANRLRTRKARYRWECLNRFLLP